MKRPALRNILHAMRWVLWLLWPSPTCWSELWWRMLDITRLLFLPTRWKAACAFTTCFPRKMHIVFACSPQSLPPTWRSVRMQIRPLAMSSIAMFSSNFELIGYLDNFFLLFHKYLLNLPVDWIRVSMSCYSRDNRDLISVVFLVVSPEDQFRRCLNLWNHQTGSVFPAETCVSSWNPCQWTAVGSGPFASKHWLGFCTSQSDCTLESSCLDLAIVSLGDCLHLIAIWPIPWPLPASKASNSCGAASKISVLVAVKWNNTTPAALKPCWELGQVISQRPSGAALRYNCKKWHSGRDGWGWCPSGPWDVWNMGSARNQWIQSRRRWFWFKVIVDS